MNERVTLAQGSGGRETEKLINELFVKNFSNEILDNMTDGAILKPFRKEIVVSTDSFVVEPIFYNGGNIGKLSVIGSVNDVLMMGAMPKYITAGFIISAGLKIDLLKKIVLSMKKTMKEANVKLISADTKVIEDTGNGIIINTSCIGEKKIKNKFPKKINDGDKILISGEIGDHHASIMSERHNIKNNIKSDNMLLIEIVEALIKENINLKIMRDITRGGLATVLNEIARKENISFEIDEEEIPIKKKVLSFSKLLGLDPLTMSNEGKLIAIISKKDSEKALKIIKKTKAGQAAKIIGFVKKIKPQNTKNFNDFVLMKTKLKTLRRVRPLEGEGLPRIC
ncbi:MAG: hydrogenase expression/formation protein HypE [Clostridiales Family XIII bacterium]|nr:hydrogenase expression/formation protein HypE [Clostridiales Family XIII bacterium]